MLNPVVGCIYRVNSHLNSMTGTEDLMSGRNVQVVNSPSLDPMSEDFHVDVVPASQVTAWMDLRGRGFSDDEIREVLGTSQSGYKTFMIDARELENCNGL